MQFLSGGPDVPDRLLQRHENGQVVFFCGAGISYPAGLPDFAGLVNRLFAQLGQEPDAVQAAAIQASRFDTAVGLLEESIQGQRGVVRRKLAEILTPALDDPSAWATHESLLTLGTNRQGKLRLVTTNFDRLFEHAIGADSARVPRLAAPHLPVPKATWDGLVYLHGRLPETPTETDLNTLIISSGDFGRAYLTERWASRFVGELFRNYSVCLIGYSLEDPVLRYMMDALAADRLLGETSPEMFAFVGAKRGEEDLRRNEWKAKHVIPILYSDADNHRHLHETLKHWAASFRDGVQGHERTVVEYAAALPLESTEEDDFVGRMFASSGFKRTAMYPCYGLAEGTLVVTGNRLGAEPLALQLARSQLVRGQAVAVAADADDRVSLVSSGVPAGDAQVLIVDPATRTVLNDGRVGEIWTCSKSVCAGYFRQRAESLSQFVACLDNASHLTFLRTGDLGFVMQGQLYVTGRLKDVILIRGHNHYPQDLEATASHCNAELAPGMAAAVTTEQADGATEVCLICELTRHGWLHAEPSAVIADVREAIAAEHGLTVTRVVLIRPGTLPRTTSGKIRRTTCRELLLCNQLHLLDRDGNISASPEPHPA